MVKTAVITCKAPEQRIPMKKGGWGDNERPVTVATRTEPLITACKDMLP
jgi:hypothetical protein